MSELEDLFAFQLRAVLPKGTKFVREAKLVPGRKYRWDFVIGDLAVEVQGGHWKASTGHTTGSGIQRDCDKGYLALKAGYKPLSITGDDVRKGEGVKRVLSLLALKA